VLALAALVHVAAVWALPRAIVAVFRHRLIAEVGPNHVKAAPLPDEGWRTVPMPSPDQLYAACAYDVSAGPVLVTADLPEGYFSISGFSDDTDNFFVIDGQPSGPDFSVKFPFEVKTVADVSATAVAKGNELTYVRELPMGQSVYTELKGYGATSKDYDIRVENSKEKVGAHIVGDKPLSKLVFWSIRKTLCPEAYVSMQLEPGKTSQWKITYDFF